MADDAWDDRLPRDPAISSSLFPECQSEHHPLTDDLALVAVGERLSDDLERHILECPPCLEAAAAWAELADLAAIGNSTADVPPPGTDVWAAIGAALALPDGPPTAGPPSVDASRPVATDASGDEATDHAPPALSSDQTGPAPAGTVVPLTGRRPARRWLVPVAAAAAGIALAVGAAVVGQQPGPDQLRAVADLTVVPGGPVTGSTLGSAELMSTSQAQMVRVAVDDLPRGSGSYEVWLFDGTGDMVSLGFLHDGQGTFVVPQGVDTERFNTVDVSDEPGDGNPAHSGISVVRGTFV